MSQSSRPTDITIGTPVVIRGVRGVTLPGNETYWGTHNLVPHSIAVVTDIDIKHRETGYRLRGLSAFGAPSNQTLVREEFDTLTPDRIEWFLHTQGVSA